MSYVQLQLTLEEMNLIVAMLATVTNPGDREKSLATKLFVHGAKTQKTPVFSGEIEVLEGEFLPWNEVVEYGEYEVFDEKGVKFGYNLLKSTRHKDVYYYVLYYNKNQIIPLYEKKTMEDKYFSKIE